MNSEILKKEYRYLGRRANHREVFLLFFIQGVEAGEFWTDPLLSLPFDSSLALIFFFAFLLFPFRFCSFHFIFSTFFCPENFLTILLFFFHLFLL